MEQRPGSGAPGGAGSGDPASTGGAGGPADARRVGWRVAGGARPGAQQSVTARPAVRGLPWAHAQHPKFSTTRATVCAGFVPPALTSPRGPGGELRPCGPCNVGTLWRHHKDTCPSLQVQRKVYALCRISLDFHKNPELKNEILSQMRKTSESGSGNLGNFRGPAGPRPAPPAV